MSALTVGSLFSGIGGLDLGFERAGFEIRWQVEIDPYCRRVLAKHWPTVARYEDVREVGAHNLERVDVIVGGFPCQPVSRSDRTLLTSQGKERHVESDSRWLWPEYGRLVSELRPRYAIVENVSELLVWGGATVLGELAACGYDAEWQLIPAAAVGAPHLRQRLFIVAYPHGERARVEAYGCGRRLRTNTDPLVAKILQRQHGEGSAAGFDASVFDALFRAWGQVVGWHKPQSMLCRVGDGIPRRVDRLRGLGNAVVPQVAQYVAECVKRHAEAQEAAA